MHKNYKQLFLLGILTIVIPFTGLPFAWKQWLLLIIGLILVGIAFIARMHTQQHEEDTTSQPEA